MGSCNKSSQLQSYQRVNQATSINMSLWKVMTMSQVPRQGAQAYETQVAGRFWGKEGFQWMSDFTSSSSSQDKSSEVSSSSEHQPQLGSNHDEGRYNSNQHQPSF